MTITSIGIDTLLIDGVDIQTVAAITDASGLLSNGPIRADVITQDWSPGAKIQIGPPDTYTFDVPVIMRSAQQDVAFGQLRSLQAYVGRVVTLTRRLVVDGVTVDEICQAAMINALQVQWSFERRAQLRAVLVWQVLTPWAPA